MTKFQRLLLGTSLAVGLALAGGSAFAADLMAPPTAPAMAAPSGAYASVFGGATLGARITGSYTSVPYMPTFPLDTGYILGVTFGANVTPNLRGELELSYTNHSATGTTTSVPTGAGFTHTFAESGSVSTLYLLGNLWYDFDGGSAITPYIGGGLGAGYVMPNFTSGSWSYSTGYLAPAAQIGVGVKFALADKVDLDLGYRLKATFNGTMIGNGMSSDVSGTSTLDQSVQVGLNFGF